MRRSVVQAERAAAAACCPQFSGRRQLWQRCRIHYHYAVLYKLTYLLIVLFTFAFILAGNMEGCNVAGYRQILESVESPARWKEKTLQAG